MLRKMIIAAASAAVVALSPAAFAQQAKASDAEAKEMLQNAVAAVALDDQKAFDMFNKGEAGFCTAIPMYFAPMLAMANSSPWATPMRKNCSALM